MLTSAGYSRELLLHTGCGQSILHSEDTESGFMSSLNMPFSGSTEAKNVLITCSAKYI